MITAGRYSRWRKSSYSGTGNNCIEAGRGCDRPDVGVRDSALGADGPVLEFCATEWAALLSVIKKGGHRLR